MTVGSMMRAAQYNKERGQVLIHDVPIPEPGDEQLQVKIVAASLCHSDIMMGLRPDNIGPVTIGHEAVGIISKMHSSSRDKGFNVGDRIGMLYMIGNCFTCEGCVVHGTFCTRPALGGVQIQGLQADGFFAEYALVHWRNAVHLPASLPIERMSPVFCAGLTAYHAVDKCDLNPGQWIAIVGCGGLGQLAIRYAKAMGLRVVGLDINDQMLQLARTQGADVIYNPQTQSKFHTDIRKLTGRRGCHAAAVFSNSKAAYKSAQRALGFNGILMVVGLPEKPLGFPAIALSLNLIQVKGASNGTPEEMKKVVDFTARHHIIPEVEFYGLDDVPQMWNKMIEGRATKRMAVLFRDPKSNL